MSLSNKVDTKIRLVEDLLRAAGPSIPLKTLFEMDPTAECLTEDDFYGLVGGTVRRGRKKAMFAHMNRCDRCRAILDDIAEGCLAEGSWRLGQPVTVPDPAPDARSKAPRSWAWVLGLAMPATVLGTALLLITLSGPVVQMHLNVVESTVRFGTVAEIRKDTVLHEGDVFVLDVKSKKDGFIYIYAWNDREGGQFVLPSGDNPENAVTKGVSNRFPHDDQWRLTDAIPGRETLYLLFSSREVDFQALEGISQELSRAGIDQHKVESIMKKHFSLEEMLSYIVM